MKHAKHYLALGAVAMLPSHYAAAQADKGNDERPNILFILSDDHTSPSWEFFDLQADPKEDHNAINDKQYQGIIKQMKAEMMRLRQETGDTDAYSPRMQEILRSQGLIK